jgi:hypothetical protein
MTTCPASVPMMVLFCHMHLPPISTPAVFLRSVNPEPQRKSSGHPYLQQAPHGDMSCECCDDAAALAATLTTPADTKQRAWVSNRNGAALPHASVTHPTGTVGNPCCVLLRHEP